MGGWTYEPWRGTFYPGGLVQKRELEFASRQVSAIEINGTYYRTQAPESFMKWRDETPGDFMFSMKALRYATNRRVLAEAATSVERFVASGISELGAKLGPIVWQFPPTQRFEPEDFEQFLKLLPQSAGGLRLRHALDVRHESFMSTGFLDLARRYGAAAVLADSDEHPSFADVTADFVYARLMRSKASVRTGYAPKDLVAWADRARIWSAGGEPDDLPRIAKPGESTAKKPRDVFIFFINGAKERAPAAAQALGALLNR